MDTSQHNRKMRAGTRLNRGHIGTQGHTGSLLSTKQLLLLEIGLLFTKQCEGEVWKEPKGYSRLCDRSISQQQMDSENNILVKI